MGLMMIEELVGCGSRLSSAATSRVNVLEAVQRFVESRGAESVKSSLVLIDEREDHPPRVDIGPGRSKRLGRAPRRSRR
jgi:hypothetical protein